MSEADKSLSSPGQLSADMLVVGGGIMGLWAAVKSAKSELSVVLVDRGKIGSGASGGLMGALFPWMPDRWDEKKQFQYDALLSLPEELAALEAETGLAAHFRRSGRIVPFPKPHLVAIHQRLERDARKSWQQGNNRFFWHVNERPPVDTYIAEEFVAFGAAHDTLAARMQPRAVIALLKAWLTRQPNVRIIEQAALTMLDPAKGRAELGHDAISFSRAIIAAGVESFPILEAFLSPMPKRLGQGVKGQAALLKADIDPSFPVVFLDGLYIVPHEGGEVAVGSTSENVYADPFSTDLQLDAVVARARALIPTLRDAPIIERWAGIRPKAIGRDPMIGPLPGHDNIIALTGGFKISFGMAHKLAESAVGYALGKDPEGLPMNFTVWGQIGQPPLADVSSKSD
jgi:glycine oxidase